MSVGRARPRVPLCAQAHFHALAAVAALAALAALAVMAALAALAALSVLATWRGRLPACRGRPRRPGTVILTAPNIVKVR